MGYAPESDAPLDLLPVDFLSELIVKMSLCEEVPGKMFNCSHPGPATWNAVLDWLKDLGHELPVVAAEEWRERYLRRIGAENVLFPLLPFYLDQAEGAWQTGFFSSVNALRIERGNTRRMVERLKMEYPAIDAQLWQRYVRRNILS